MIEEILGLDRENIQTHHDIIMQELIDYNAGLQITLQMFKEYEEVDGMSKAEFVLNEQDIIYTILGTTSALLFVYNKLEKYEFSAEIHAEMKKSFLLIYDEIFPDIDNEEKFFDLMDKMFTTYKKITE